MLSNEVNIMNRGFTLSILLIIGFLAIARCQDKPKSVDVKIVPVNQFRMQTQELAKIKEEIEYELKEKVHQIEENWAANERLKERSSGVWNQEGSPIFAGLANNYQNYNMMGFPNAISQNFWQNYIDFANKNKKSTGNSDNQNQKAEEAIDKLGTQLKNANSAISELKQSVTQSKDSRKSKQTQTNMKDGKETDPAGNVADAGSQAAGADASKAGGEGRFQESGDHDSTPSRKLLKTIDPTNSFGAAAMGGSEIKKEIRPTLSSEKSAVANKPLNNFQNSSSLTSENQIEPELLMALKNPALINDDYLKKNMDNLEKQVASAYDRFEKKKESQKSGLISRFLEKKDNNITSGPNLNTTVNSTEQPEEGSKPINASGKSEDNANTSDSAQIHDQKSQPNQNVLTHEHDGAHSNRAPEKELETSKIHGGPTVNQLPSPSGPKVSQSSTGGGGLRKNGPIKDFQNSDPLYPFLNFQS